MTEKGAPDWTSLVGAAERLGRALELQGARVVTAESCTGGLIAALLTETAGSSAWFDRGFVTYSNDSKSRQLKVCEQVLARYGAVSEPVVRQMAVGALRASQACLAIAVSGVAGPGGGSAEKPVGTVCLGWAIADSQDVRAMGSPIAGGMQPAAEDPGPGAGQAAAGGPRPAVGPGVRVYAASIHFPGDRHAVRAFSARLALRVAGQLWSSARPSIGQWRPATRI
jgi:nicotinamide-nucleotide amidase